LSRSETNTSAGKSSRGRGLSRRNSAVEERLKKRVKKLEDAAAEALPERKKVTKMAVGKIEVFEEVIDTFIHVSTTKS
jgi:hypothetical protein